MTQLTVHARPARETANPYTSLLADALERQGVTVREVGMTLGDLPLAPGILLLHWPDEFFRRPRDMRSAASAALRLARIAIARRLHRLAVVWVAHNARPHDEHRGSPPLLWKLFLRLVDAMIALSEDSMAQVLAAYPALAGKKRLVIAHGHYLDRATRPPCLPEPLAGRPVRLAALGMIRAYKNTAALARAVAANGDDILLTIAGAPSPQALGDELTSIAASCPRITLDLARPSDAELESATDAADLVVLPYGEVLNSGALFHALSRYRPVAAPRMGSLPEVRQEVGEQWIHLFDGDFGPRALAGAIDWLRRTARDAPPDLSGQDWDRIGRTVAVFLNDLARR